MPHLTSFELAGRTVIVTGAGRGIGRTISLDAVQSGARIAVGSRTMTELETLKAEQNYDGVEAPESTGAQIVEYRPDEDTAD